MSRILVFTNPAHDRTTEYIGAWCEKAIELAKLQPDTVVVDLVGADANRAVLEKTIAEHNPEIIFFNGHGASDHLCGHNKEVLIQVNENAHLLQGKIVHALACDAGSQLGPEIIRIGGKRFIGYKKNFEFFHLNKTSKQEQLEDEIAKFFLAPAFKAIEAIILGEPVETAFSKSQGLYKENLLQLLASDNPDYNTALAAKLYHDLVNQVLLGSSQPPLV